MKQNKRKTKKIFQILSAAAAFTIIMSLGISAYALQGNGGGTPPTPPTSEGTSQENQGTPLGEPPQGGMGSADTMSYDYTGELSGVLDADGTELTSQSETLEAQDADVNVVLAQNGGTATVTDDVLNKSGDDNDGDSCNFYGVNSIVLSSGEGSRVFVQNSELTADSTGSNAVFATDSATVYISGSQIRTSSDNSRGLDATYGGTVIGDDLTIETQGEHCAALATDRGGGFVSLANSTLTTAGFGSPLLYSTGDIEVSNVYGIATGSQIAGMEGLNTILIENSELSSTITGKTASDPVANGIILYQSTSGDAESATGERARFQAVDSMLSSDITSGAMFYVTNTAVDVVLSGTELDFDTDNVLLLQATGNDSNNWGSAGSNGADVNFTAIGQTLQGDIEADSISSVTLTLLEGSSYTGAIQVTENSTGSSIDTNAVVQIDSQSTWIVTEDTLIDALYMEEGAQLVDTQGNTVSVLMNGRTVIDGTSDLTVTVQNYDTQITTDDSNVISENLIDRSEFEAWAETGEAAEASEDSVTAQTETQSNADNVAEQVTEETQKAGTPVVPIVTAAIAAAAAAVIVPVTVTAARRKKKE